MLIFLDIDGVMVPAQSWKVPECLQDGFAAFSAKASQVLQQIVTEEDTVILTTSHKAKYNMATWKDIFKHRGIDITNLQTLPENINHFSRKDEILQWFNMHNSAEDFIIIDDDSSLHALPAFLKEKWVQTNPSIGLTEAHKKAIQVILKAAVVQ